MKKITIPILLTLSLGSLFGPIKNASATIQDQGVTWWSVSELLEFYEEVETERIATCGDDYGCNRNFDSNYFESSEKYRALQNILEGQILVTAVNPANETIKVLFYDENMMLRRMGIKEYLELEHLYFGWFEEWNGQIYNYNHDSFTDGSTPGSHPLYDSTIEDLSVIAPWEEVELSVAGGNLINNLSGKLDYAAFAKQNKYNAQGYFDYSSCLNAPDYEEGMECKMMASGDRWIAYFPPREEITEGNEQVAGENELGVDGTESNTNDEPTPNSDGSSNNEAGTNGAEIETNANGIELAVNNTEIVGTEKESNNKLSEDQKGEEKNANNPEAIPLAPNTGELSRAKGNNNKSFLIVLAVIGVLYATWWLVPTKTAKEKKKYKKSIKKS